MVSKLKVGVVGATGMVGQRFVSILADHPWFEVVSVSASERSAGRAYRNAVEGRWAMTASIPDSIGKLVVGNASEVEQVSGQVDFVFCAVDMPKGQTRELEERYALAETPVVSNNSAHRWTPDVPMLIPEVNAAHITVIESQRKRLGVRNGFIAVKPNCSIQSYVPAFHALKEFRVEKIFVCTYQAISGAGKTFKDWPEMVDNVIPTIEGLKVPKFPSHPNRYTNRCIFAPSRTYRPNFELSSREKRQTEFAVLIRIVLDFPVLV